MTQPLTDLTDEIEAVRAVVVQYVDAVRVGDTALLAEILHPDGWMYGHLDGDPLIMPIGRFVALGESFTAPATSGEPYRTAIASVEVHGTVAVATLHESSYLGMDFTDLFVLLRTDGLWRIVTKTFDQRTPGSV